MVEQITEIVNAFIAFYSALYSTRAHYTIVELDDNLYNIPMVPRLSTSQILLLDAPLTSEEKGTAMQSFASNERPGFDGFPTEWYLQYKEIWIPHLLWVFNYTFEEGRLPPSTSEALIVRLLKPKDPLYCESYRPISLINSGVKNSGQSPCS